MTGNYSVKKIAVLMFCAGVLLTNFVACAPSTRQEPSTREVLKFGDVVRLPASDFVRREDERLYPLPRQVYRVYHAGRGNWLPHGRASVHEGDRFDVHFGLD